MKKNILNAFLVLGILIGLGSCKNAMDEHVEITNLDNSVTLAEKIAAQANLSKFSEFLKSTGYEQLLASSKSYTVWAPTNAALASLDATITADPARLKDFVANHIALTTIASSKGTTDTLKINLINGKFATVIGTNFEEAGIEGAGSFVKNGALFTINKAVETKKNIWEYLLTSTDAPMQTAFIGSLSAQVIDTVNATIIGYNSLGNPIFAPNPPMIARNSYWSDVADLRAEGQLFTYFMVQDPVYSAEVVKIAPYYLGYSQHAFVRDLAVKGMFTEDKLPTELRSTKGVKIQINKTDIVKSYRASNGMVYVIKALPFNLDDKVPVFKIEGEQPYAFRVDRTGNTSYRTKIDNLGLPYRDIQVYNHGVSEFYVEYRRGLVPLVKYKVYARATSGHTGDPQVANFTQRYLIYNPITLVYDTFATQIVTPLNFGEVYLGEYTPQQFGALQLRLIAAASTAVNVNTLILDYLRFEPILP